MESLYLETDYGRIHARAAGDPVDPLILGVHGWSKRNGWHTWEPLMEPLAAAGYYVVAVDMPGWGESSSTSEGPMHPETAQAALLAIMDELDNEEAAAILGKSWGGNVALQLALNHPERVQKLILTAPAFSDFDRLPDLQQPLLLAWSRDDQVIPYDITTKYTSVLPLVQLISYETGGHSAAPNNAADFAPIAIDFLAS